MGLDGSVIRATFVFLQKKGFFYLLSANFLTQFLGFGTTILVAKFISLTEIGQIRIIQSYAAIFAILAGFGFNTAVIKYCSENIPQEQRLRILNYAVRCSFITTCGSFLLWCFFVYYDVILPSSHLHSYILIFGLSLPFWVSTNIGMSFLQATKQVKKMAKIQSLIKLLSFIIIVGSAFWGGLQGFIISTVFAYFIGTIPIFKEIGTSFFNTKYLIPNGIKSMALFSMLGNSVSLLGQYGDIFILNYCYTDKEQIGYYSLATIFLIGAMQITGTIQSIVTPYFSENSKNKEWIYMQLKKNQLRMAILSIIMAIIIYYGCFIFIPFFYGNDYTMTLPYLKLLMVKYVIYSSYSIIGVCLLGLGLVKSNFIVVCTTTPINWGISYFCLQHYEIIGIAYAQIISSSFTFICVIIVAGYSLKRYFAGVFSN